MDLKSKGITWVGSIYQRFESVCQEVDSLMAQWSCLFIGHATFPLLIELLVGQEKVKYVKRQVQVSCENVQKLYAETVQDLIPFPPGDSVKGYRYISEMFEGEKTKVGSKECLKDERLFSSSQSEGIASVDKDSSAIPPVDSCSANENTLLRCKLETSVFLEKDSSAIPLVDSCSANENVSLHSQLEAHVDSFSAKENVSLHSRLEASSLDKDSSAIPLVDSCSLHSHSEESISLDNDSSAIPLVDSCSLYSQFEASISLDKDSGAIPFVDSCSLDSQLETSTLDKDSGAIPCMDSRSLHSQLKASTSLGKDSSAIPLMDSCSLDSQWETSTSLDKDSSAIPLVDTCSLHSQLEAGTSLVKDSSAIPLVDSCSLHSQLEVSTSLDKDSSAIPLMNSSSLDCQLEASTSLDKESSIISLVDSCSANENALLHHQLETSVCMDKDSSANACSPNESILWNSQFELSISLNEDPGVTSSCSGCFMDEELYLPFHSKVSVSLDEVSTAASLLDGMPEPDINQPEAFDTMMNTNRVSVEATEQYYTQRAVENYGNSDVGSCISESSNVLPNELVIPALPHEKVLEHRLMLLVLESSTDLTDSSARANHVETCIATEESTQIPTEVAGQNCPRKAGGNNNSNLVLQDASHRETVDDKSIPSNYISSLSMDLAEACTTLAEESIPFLEVIGQEFPERAEEKSTVSGAAVKAVSTSSNNFGCEESSKRAVAVGLNSVTEEEFENVRLDDDFVDSEAEKDEVYLITLLASRKRSYKKKLQDALLSTIRTTKRENPREIIAWYRDFNKSTKQRKNLKEIQFEDGTESDWELV
ncbi:hypothetical protein ACLOJK_008848 [Asimina triloba]